MKTKRIPWVSRSVRQGTHRHFSDVTTIRIVTSENIDRSPRDVVRQPRLQLSSFRSIGPEDRVDTQFKH